ncbi:MAG: hypothetical protein CMM60_04280 [Rhodospirillaceae bacterium]|jgi:xanthine/uracil permease|nr:hypothetical protein [Rhodospirillaceae bacterium]|tara:strand:- start:11664 stop:11900 length:237 start_codon:yes stop_codon:yes gene_type:complete
MENIYKVIISNPIYIAIAAILSISIVYKFVKKIFKLFIIIIALIFIYVAYFHYTGKDTDKLKEKIKDKVGQVESLPKD